MKILHRDIEIACRQQLERFFSTYPDAALQKRAIKAMRFLATSEEALAGKPEGWAAGIIYSLANHDRYACGIPGLLNSEFEKFFGVSMGTVRKRAARVAEAVSI